MLLILPPPPHSNLLKTESTEHKPQKPQCIPAAGVSKFLEFIIAKLSIRKLESSSVQIIILLPLIKIRAYGLKAVQ